MHSVAVVESRSLDQRRCAPSPACGGGSGWGCLGILARRCAFVFSKRTSRRSAKAPQYPAPPHLAPAQNGGHAALCPPYAEPPCMQYDPSDLKPRERYKVLTSFVLPRPIAWVTSMGPAGVVNAAPFSFFNVFCEDPPLCMFAANLRPDGRVK